MKTKKTDINYSEDIRLALLEQSINHINQTLIRFEHRFDKIDEKFDKIDERFDKMDKRFINLETKMDNKFIAMDNKIDTNFHWLLGSIFGLYAMCLTGLLGALGHSYGWF